MSFPADVAHETGIRKAAESEEQASPDLLTDCMYNSDWPDMNPRIRRLILMFMVYLNRPMTLKAGGFFHVGLPLFTKVVKVYPEFLFIRLLYFLDHESSL